MKHYFLLVALGGIFLGLSQPLVLSFIKETPLDSSGLSGLLSFIGFVPLFIIWQKKYNYKTVVILSFITQFVQYLITFYWIYVALHVFGNISIIFSSLICILLAIVVAGLNTIPFFVGYLVQTYWNTPRWLVYTASFCAMSYVLNYWPFGGFPWGNIGYSLVSVPLLLQQMSVWGVYGVVFFVMLINFMIADILGFFLYNKSFNKGLLIVSCIFSVIVFTTGFKQLYFSASINDNKKVKIGLLQGNIEQGIKNQARIYSNNILERYLLLQSQAIKNGAQIVIWPETAYPYTINAQTHKLEHFDDINVPIVLGAMVKEPINFKESYYHNSALMINKNQTITDWIHKSHLVPFGEYVPWPFKNIVSKIVPGFGEFKPGKNFMPLIVDIDEQTRLSMGVSICFEGVFPEISRKFANNKANLLVNISNDAWYGVSSASFQHLNMYAARAVESGRSFVRATNTGVSAVIDNLGFVHYPTALYEQAVIVADVSLANKNTLYLFWGDILPQLCLILMLLAFTLSFFNIKKQLWYKKI
jgi:apolipoprotein N-acyltransferase